MGEAPPRVGEAVAQQRLVAEDAYEDVATQEDQGHADSDASPADSRMQGELQYWCAFAHISAAAYTRF